MKNKKLSAEILLNGTGVSVLDAVRLVLNILDSRDKSSSLSPIEFCHKVIEVGKRHIRFKEMNFAEGLALFIESKKHLRPDSFRDIKYLSSRFIKTKLEFANRNFSDFSVSDCEWWLAQTFSTPSQHNKGRAMLHGLFEFALRREWCERNPIKFVERKKVIENEIKPLSLVEVKRIIKVSRLPKFKDCLPAVALLIYAGIRPREVRRLKWRDIDLSENSITVRSQCSKTGGVRQVEIYPVLKNCLAEYDSKSDSELCPQSWQRRWKSIRDTAGFKGEWRQDVLRHTYASYHAKRFQDLPRLQINMGHRDQNLLRARYVNMVGIASYEAKSFFAN